MAMEKWFGMMVLIILECGNKDFNGEKVNIVKIKNNQSLVFLKKMFLFRIL